MLTAIMEVFRRLAGELGYSAWEVADVLGLRAQRDRSAICPRSPARAWRTDKSLAKNRVRITRLFARAVNEAYGKGYRMRELAAAFRTSPRTVCSMIRHKRSRGAHPEIERWTCLCGSKKCPLGEGDSSGFDYRDSGFGALVHASFLDGRVYLTG